MENYQPQQSVRIRAISPGVFPILVVELPSDVLRAVYFETGYDLERRPSRADARRIPRRLREAGAPLEQVRFAKRPYSPCPDP